MSSCHRGGACQRDTLITTVSELGLINPYTIVIFEILLFLGVRDGDVVVKTLVVQLRACRRRRFLPYREFTKIQMGDDDVFWIHPRTMKSSSRFLNWRGRFGSGTTEAPHRAAMPPKKQPQEYPVTVEIEGKRYTGFYTVSSGVVAVESDWGERSIQTGTRAEEMARLLRLENLQRAKVPVTLPAATLYL